MSTPAEDISVGPLSFRFESSSGMVRAVRWHGHEIVRGIYPAVRDADWGTLPAIVSPIARDTGPDTVRLQCRGHVKSAQAEVEWHAEITAHASGELCYRWRARALRAFDTNRTGLCVLHPAELAGEPCVSEHVDGTKVAGWFPTRVSPHQPFRNVRALTHVLSGNTEITVRMEGDVFETEDQRNWSDASFKTYSRPLDLPKPYPLAAGETVEHCVTISARGSPSPARSHAGPVFLSPSGTAVPLPRLGFTLPGPLPHALRARLHALRPDHLRVEATASDLPRVLAWAAPEAASADCALDVAIRDATAEPPPRDLFPERCTVHLFDSAGNAAEPATLEAWHAAGFHSLATGTLNHFTELNRQRPFAAAPHAFTTFGLNAQVHAFDDTSLLETVTQHGVLAQHAHALGAGRRVLVAPLVLGPTAATDDARLRSDFAATWLLGSIVGLTAARGVERVTLLRTHGAGGILGNGAPTPTEHLLLSLVGTREAQLMQPARGQQAPLHAMMIPALSGRILLMAHHGEQDIETEIPVASMGGPLGAAGRRFQPGRITLPPRSVWQLQLPS